MFELFSKPLRDGWQTLLLYKSFVSWVLGGQRVGVAQGGTGGFPHTFNFTPWKLAGHGFEGLTTLPWLINVTYPSDLPHWEE